MMDIDLTPLVNAIIGIAATLMTTFLIPWLVKKMKQADRERLLDFIETAVYAADKLKLTGQITDKMAYVQKYLETNGMKLDVTAIEAYVKKLDLAEELKKGLCAPDTVVNNITK